MEIWYFFSHCMTDSSFEIHVSYLLFLILRNECSETEGNNLLSHQFLQFWKEYYERLN